MKYFLGFIGVVALIILVFVLVIRGFSGNDNDKPKETKTTLASYANTSTVVRYTAQGAVTANQNYREIRVTVGRDANTIEIIQGYEGQVVKAKTYPNNREAYGNFLRALEILGYTNGVEDPKLADERGYCSSGSRYVYEIISGGSDIQRYWIGTCGQGTFKGSSANIRALFRKQIPDYNTFVGNLNINQ
jgi:hypothetical protein